MRQIKDVINECRTKSESFLIDNQLGYIPRVNCDQIEYLCYNYFVDGRLIRYIPMGPKCCFKLRYLELKPNKRRRRNNIDGMKTLAELVQTGVVLPFMLFINGRFIPWNIISLSLDHGSYWMMVDSTDSAFADDCVNIKYTQIINLPDGCRMVEDFDSESSPMFSFNEQGEFNINATKYAIVQTKPGNSVVFTNFAASGDINGYPVITGVNDLVLNEKNFIVFKNGTLSTGPIEKIKRAHDSDHFDPATGKVTPCIEFLTDPEPLPEMTNVKVFTTYLTVEDGTNPKKDQYGICTFINGNYIESMNHVTKAIPEKVNEMVINDNKKVANPSFWSELKTPFNFHPDKNKTAAQNEADAIKAIYEYDSSEFNDIFESGTNVLFDEHDYHWLRSNTRQDGVLVMPRKHSHMIDEYFLLFVNGCLYKYRHAGKYIASNYYLPIQGINEGDSIEVMRFQNINNTTLNITVREDDPYSEVDSAIINQDMILFSTVTDQTHYTYPEDGLQHFPVEYALDYDENGKVKIILENDFYYGKPLVATSSNRFKHFCYYLGETPQEMYDLSIDLEDKFMYCNDYSKYMVFYNGRKLNSDHYRLTLPVRPTTPFSKFTIYLTFPVAEGDHLDVIYVPAYMKDFVSDYDLNAKMIENPGKYSNSEIVFDKTMLSYPLSSKLFMVWVNGKKVPQSHIVDIDSTRMRIMVDPLSTKNVCITKYTPDISRLCEVFESTRSLWDNMIDKMSLEDIANILGIDTTSISDIEPNIYSGAISIRAIMYELIREHYVGNTSINVTEGFVYDYQDVDQSILEVDENGEPIVDSVGNTILEVLESDKRDNIDNVTRPWP